MQNAPCVAYLTESLLVIDDPGLSIDLENRVAILSFLRFKLNQALQLFFDTGEEKIFDFMDLFGKPAFVPLVDREFFEKVVLDYGVPVWQGEVLISTSCRASVWANIRQLVLEDEWLHERTAHYMSWLWRGGLSHNELIRVFSCDKNEASSRLLEQWENVCDTGTED